VPESHGDGEVLDASGGAGASAAAVAAAGAGAVRGGDGALDRSAAGAGLEAGSPERRVRRLGATAVAGLVAGAGLLVFADAGWLHVLGVAGLLVCAVSVFGLTGSPLDR
jgi:hypothetical protein